MITFIENKGENFFGKLCRTIGYLGLGGKSKNEEANT
jgi:hypothetical protein